MIKILFTIPNFDTAGSGKALLNIAKGLDRNVFEPHIMCKHNRGEFFKIVEDSEIPIHIFGYETQMRPIIQGLRGCWKVSRILKKIKPDIIHSFHYSADYSEALAARIANRKWIFTKKNMNWGGGSKNAWHLRSILANGIIVQNFDMIERFYPKSDKTILIPRGVQTKHFYDEKNPPADLNCNYKTIICVANLVPVKGIEVLIEAFIQIKKNNPSQNWKLKIVGEDKNSYGVDLKKRYKHLIDDGLLIFTGKIVDVFAELNKCDIFVLPTLNEGRMEGSPVSLLEAMSMGLPVLGSKIPGISDQLLPLGEDHLFEAGSVRELTEKLEKIMVLPNEKIRGMRSRIRSYCQSKWDISIEIEKHESFYLKILGINQ